MAKRVDKIKKVEQTGEIILLTDPTNFVYEVSIYKIEPLSFSLEDVREVKTKTFSPNTSSNFTKDGINFLKKVELIKIPKNYKLKQDV